MNYLRNLILNIFTKFKLLIAGARGSAAYRTSHMVAEDDCQNAAAGARGSAAYRTSHMVAENDSLKKATENLSDLESKQKKLKQNIRELEEELSKSEKSSLLGKLMKRSPQKIKSDINKAESKISSIQNDIDDCQNAAAGARGSAAYWTFHTVAEDDWRNAADSLDHFKWRNQQYPGYIQLMPVNVADDLVVLDYGCGPGNDLVGFSEFSNPARLIGADVSPTALDASKKRLALHRKTAEFLLIDEESNKINLPDKAVDLVHSSGVLHHVKNLEAALSEIHRVLKVGGCFRVMIYNYDSLWLHLYTAYIHQIEMGRYSKLDLLDAFKRTTDGPNCPISHCYRPSQFVEIVTKNGFSGHFKGSAISVDELTWLPKRFDAIKCRNLNVEHRNFLSAISFDRNGHPLVDGHVAGIDGCFEFKKV